MDFVIAQQQVVTDSWMAVCNSSCIYLCFSRMIPPCGVLRDKIHTHGLVKHIHALSVVHANHTPLAWCQEAANMYGKHIYHNSATGVGGYASLTVQRKLKLCSITVFYINFSINTLLPFFFFFSYFYI